MPQWSIEPNSRVTYKVRFADEAFLVVSKPPGVVTTPGLGHERDSLMNGLFSEYGSRLQKLGKHRDFGLLHRLDRETSGLVIVALTVEAYEAIRAGFESRSIEKYYWAVCKQAPKQPKGLIRRAIAEYEGKSPGDPRTKKLARISPQGKPALTAYRVLSSAPHGALVECRTLTGRLHQVRVHLDSIGCAILGDDTYGPKAVREAAPRLALHAHRIVLSHPVTGARVECTAPWPADLKSLLVRLGLPRPDLSPSGSVGGVKGRRKVQDDGVGDQKPIISE